MGYKECSLHDVTTQLYEQMTKRQVLYKNIHLYLMIILVIVNCYK